MDTKTIKKKYKQKGLYKQSLHSDLLDRACEFAGKYVIYGLSGSESPSNIRYVGFTSRLLNLRYNDHIAVAKKNKNSKDQWILNLIQNGEKMVFTILEDGIQTRDEACECEIYIIRKYLDANFILLNKTAGGKGLKGFRHSNETKAKQRSARLAKPPRKRRYVSKEERARIRHVYYLRSVSRKAKKEQQVFV